MNEVETEASLEPQRQLFLNALGAPFSELVFRFLALTAALDLLLFEVVVFSQTTSLRDYLKMVEPGYAFASIALALLLAALFGWAVAQAVYLVRGRGIRPAWERILLGGALAAVSTGCPTCGAPLLSAMGIRGGLGAFPLAGVEIKLLSGVLLGTALWDGVRAGAKDDLEAEAESEVDSTWRDGRRARRQMARQRARSALMVFGSVLAVYLLPLLPSGARIDVATEDAERYRQLANAERLRSERSRLIEVINPPEGYTLPVTYGDIGPRLLEAGAIDLEALRLTYERAGKPLTADQLAILTRGSQGPIVIDRENAYFLLNFFWAFGLTNQNPLLDAGPMMTYSGGDVGGFASTGGWTLGRRPAVDLYSSASIVPLDPGQQESLERVAAGIYRPCCNNPTVFPDCNHGMAMLGLLELMAAQGASEDEMFEAARYVNAFWFPQQALEVATYLQAAEGTDFAEAEARQIVGPELSSAAGFGMVHAWLAENGLLDQAPGQGGSCGV